MNVYVYMYVYGQRYIRPDMCICIYIHKYVCAYMDLCRLTCMSVIMYVDRHACILAYMHAYMHTYGM